MGPVAAVPASVYLQYRQSLSIAMLLVRRELMLGLSTLLKESRQTTAWTARASRSYGRQTFVRS